MPRTALVTGASSGLGAEYARQLAARGFHLVVVSPEEAVLETLANGLRERHGVEVEVISADLLVPERLEEVVRRLSDPGRPIDLLVNSAGFGLARSFEVNEVEDEVRHLDLHVQVPLRLTHAALGPMLQRSRGRIVYLASVAGFVPFGTYGACKAWLISFSRWGNRTYRGRGITMTAVCPGFTRTEFQARMGISPGEEGLPGWMWLEARDVVAQSLRDIARGRAVSIPTARYKALAAFGRLLPASAAVRLVQRGR